jgi:hypothetical protein
MYTTSKQLALIGQKTRSCSDWAWIGPKRMEVDIVQTLECHKADLFLSVDIARCTSTALTKAIGSESRKEAMTQTVKCK